MLIYFGYNILINQYIWVTIAWAVWVVSVGGWAFVKIEKPEKYEKDKRGNIISYFDEAIREQYVYEGFIISSVCVAVAFAIILSINIHKYIENGIVLRIIILVLLILSFAGIDFILVVFQWKIGDSYDPTFKYPYYKGPWRKN